jgi:hypothetical protein
MEQKQPDNIEEESDADALEIYITLMRAIDSRLCHVIDEMDEHYAQEFGYDSPSIWFALMHKSFTECGKMGIDSQILFDSLVAISDLSKEDVAMGDEDGREVGDLSPDRILH